jgi:hypothetical protein
MPEVSRLRLPRIHASSRKYFRRTAKAQGLHALVYVSSAHSEARALARAESALALHPLPMKVFMLKSITPPLRSLSVLLALAAARQLQAGEPDSLDQLVKRLIVEHAPRSYEKYDGWGRTVEITSGLDVRRDGLQIRTHRRHRQVYHGTWKHYAFRVQEPERDLQVRIERRANAANGGLQFDVTVTARVRASGRLRKWNHGVHLGSISGDADAVVQMHLRCQLGVELETTRFPPDVLLRPHVHQADLTLLDLDVRRISALRGELAEELGRGLRHAAQQKLDESEPKLVEKMNAKFAEHRDDFRLSLVDWAAAQFSDKKPAVPTAKDAPKR